MSSVFDLDHIRDQWGELPDDVYRSILPLFVEDGERFWNTLGKALQEMDRGAIAAAAHTLRGASGNIGAMELAQCAALLENAAPSASAEQLRPIITELDGAWRAVRATIEAGGPDIGGP